MMAQNKKFQGGSEPRAKKFLGQNFLQDGNIARKIVDALAIVAQDQVLEIGPGPGALSDIIQAREPARLVLVEKDPYWARERMQKGRAFSQIQGGASTRFAVILADALDMPWERFNTPWKIIGNLPYNVASPLMWDIFSRTPGLTRAVFMVQKEVGQRITASPGTSAYGALSVWVQSYVRAKLEFIVPSQVFRPRPKVDSAVLSFEPQSPIPPSDFVPESLARVLKLCFQMRRKQLGTILRANGADPGVLELLGIAAQTRPEKLAPAEFHMLARVLFSGEK